MAPSPRIADALAKAEALPASSGDAGPAYESILADLPILSDPASRADDLNAIFDSFFLQGLGVVATRSVLNAFVDTLAALPSQSAPSSSSSSSTSGGPPSGPGPAPSQLWIDVGTRTLRSIADQASPFAHATAKIYTLIGQAHEDQGEFHLAAQAFAKIPLDSSHRKLTDEDRAAVWIRIARNHLETGDHVAAETYINKLKNIMHSVADGGDKALTLHFRLSEARIHDAKREFLPAAAKYHKISFSTDVADDDQLRTLAMAVRCAVLAPAGPQRSIALARLYKDDRCAQLPDFAILEKMFLDRLLSPREVAQFAERLQPHQLATTADGSTVLDKAVVEHNLLGASRLYDNIRFRDLGALLGLDPDRAEETTARMIEQGRLAGRMDQLDGIVWFEGRDASGGGGGGGGNGSASASGGGGDNSHANSNKGAGLFGREMRAWDANVESLAEEVENITNSLQKEFPDFVAANLHV
ncbi:COP9 signalosome complex subunit 4 [Escovopsis weberi]|uniref:COP9 signalosome complex subunit 4 n=1 Tax=Escovopsis weberi TaxID=150374 RepID=A0A0N0RSS5_ESCWE|nr:COP9 signalosome complex subunit 4 [Escovopsis weberi]